DVTLAVDEGETVAVIGANGAGKSTLLRTVAGLQDRVTGTVAFDGAPLDGVPTHRRLGLGIAMVPEGRRIFPSLTVEENLKVGVVRGRSGRWDVASVLELFGALADKRGRPGSLLSGGEQQMLAIGRALMANPRLLLLDEVSLGLAPLVVRRIYETLPEITAAGATVVLVEQDIGQALAGADRVYCLLEGRVALQGRPAELTREQITDAYFGLGGSGGSSRAPRWDGDA
ncbi:MAG TPA: ABC transporter ATP-binding protein, partial [Actinomycetes bacterium]|nr:ABC transporter ATP-binding protein [Actinomycetes bacterium]